MLFYLEYLKGESRNISLEAYHISWSTLDAQSGLLILDIEQTTRTTFQNKCPLKFNSNYKKKTNSSVQTQPKA